MRIICTVVVHGEVRLIIAFRPERPASVRVRYVWVCLYIRIYIYIYIKDTTRVSQMDTNSNENRCGPSILLNFSAAINVSKRTFGSA